MTFPPNHLIDASAGMSVREYVQVLRLVAGVFLGAALILLLHRAWGVRPASGRPSLTLRPASHFGGNWAVYALLIPGFLFLALAFEAQQASNGPEASSSSSEAVSTGSSPDRVAVTEAAKSDLTPARRQGVKLRRRPAAAAAPASHNAPSETPPAEMVKVQPAPAADEVAGVAGPRYPHRATIAAGTVLMVRTGNTLSTARDMKGDTFSAILEQPLVSGGVVLVEKGATVEGVIARSDRPGRVERLSNLSLELVQLETAGGRKQSIATDRYEVQGKQSRRSGAKKFGVRAAIGAVIGAVAGGKDAVIPGESSLIFHLRTSLDLPEAAR